MHSSERNRSRYRPRGIWPRIGAVLLAAALVAAGSLSALLGIADLRAVDARQFLGAIQRDHRGGGRANLPAWWILGVDGLRIARHLIPANADYAADLARMYEYQSWQQIHNASAAAQYQQAAVVTYEQVLQNRPGWGYAWSELALARARLFGVDDKVHEALLNATEAAPWERHAQRKIVWLGMSRWGDLSYSTRQLVRETVVRAWTIGNDRAGIRRQARQFGWQQELDRLKLPQEPAS